MSTPLIAKFAILKYMKAYGVKILRKAAVLTVGLPLLLVGLVLIPAPGPGLPVVALALCILGIEFEIAQRYLQVCKQKFADIYSRSVDKYHKSVDTLDE